MSAPDLEPTNPPPMASPTAAATSAPALSSPEATPVPAPTFNLSPHAAPFFPPTEGRTKEQRWRGSLSPDLELPRRSYKEVLCSDKESGKNAKPATPEPLQPPRLRSEIHRISEAAPDADGWRTLRRRRRHPKSIEPPKTKIPTAMLGGCFNCLEKGHLNANCREPTRCLRCGRPGHWSFECCWQRHSVAAPWHSRSRGHSQMPHGHEAQPSATQVPESGPV